jgi:hypothetical protein
MLAAQRSWTGALVIKPRVILKVVEKGVGCLKFCLDNFNRTGDQRCKHTSCSACSKCCDERSLRHLLLLLLRRRRLRRRLLHINQSQPLLPRRLPFHLTTAPAPPLSARGVAPRHAPKSDLQQQTLQKSVSKNCKIRVPQNLSKVAAAHQAFDTILMLNRPRGPLVKYMRMYRTKTIHQRNY